MHYKRELRREGKLASPWDERRRANWQARRALKLGAAVEPFTLSDVISRDGIACGICGVDVDLTLAHPDPFSKSLDHVVPLSRGGAHTADNCQLAHLRCNVSKGARVA
jgi:5-methylcytosine-specific restriction endonuclease McrA